MNLFDEMMLTYTDISLDINKLRDEVDNLDEDSLVDEVGALRYNIDGKESEKIEHILFKNYSNEELDDDELQFLRDIYVIYYAEFAILLDTNEDDEEDE
jgi:hypothetical protein